MDVVIVSLPYVLCGLFLAALAAIGVEGVRW